MPKLLSSPGPVFALASGVRGWIACAVVVRIGVLACYLGQGILVASLLGGLLTGAGLADRPGALAWLLALVLARAGLLWVSAVLAQQTGARTTESLREQGFRQLAALGPTYLAGARTGEVREALVDGVEALETYYGSFVPALVAGLLAPVSVVVLLGTQDGWLALLVAVFALAALVLPPLWMRMLTDRSSDRMSAYLGLGSSFLDTLQGMTTLRVLGAVPGRRRELAENSDRLIRTWNREMAVALVPGGIYALAIAGGAAGVGIVAALRVAEHGLPVSTMFLALLLTREALRPLGVLAGAFHTSYSAAEAAGRISALLHATPPAPARPDTTAVAGLGATVRFTDVSFGYSAQRCVLRGFDLDIPAGATVAVVGASGTGKTTLAALLLRFVDPDSGAVHIGGTDVRDLPADQLRASVALVAQDTYLFGGTVADNLRIARPSATREELDAATRTAGLHEEIELLPDGYDTLLGERGIRLSGGQRQRLAIARAVLADAPILVLDEATASVDADTEAAIQTALERVTAERTTLVIAHRLSTVRNADRIVVLADGRVAEAGGHAELVAAGGAYARMVAGHPIDDTILENAR